MKRLLLSILIISLFSCSHTKKKVSKNHEESERQELSYKAVSEKLDEMVQKAKKEGPESVNFLAGDFYLKASDASHVGDLQTSVLLFEKLVNLVPGDEFLMRKLAVDLIKIGQIEKSLEIVKKVYEQSKKREDTSGLLLGGLYTALNKPKMAQKIYKEIQKFHPKNEEACLYVVKSYVDLGDFKNSKKEGRKCQKKFPKSAVFIYQMGKIALKEDNEDKALFYFRKALKLDPDYYQASIGIGLVYESQGKFEDATKIYRKYLDVDPNNYTILSRYVQILFSEGKFLEVIPFAETLVNLDPSNLNLKVKLAILYTDAGKVEEAKSAFKEILIEVPKSDKVLFYLGSLYQKTSESDEAITYYNKIEPESSLFLESHLQIANILKSMALKEYLSKGRIGKKYKDFSDFLDISFKKHKEHVLNFSIVLVGFFEEVGKLKDAISELTQLSQDKKFTDDHRYYLASLHEKNGEVETARDIIRGVLEKDPNNAHALNFIGYSMIDVGDNLDQGYKYVTKALEIRPDDGFIRDSLGWYFYKIGKLDKALKELSKAKEIESKDYVITKHLAVVYQELRSYSLAKKVFEEALELCKEDKEIKEISNNIERLEKILRLPASN